MTPLEDALPSQPTPLGEFPRKPAHLSNWPEPIHHALDDLVHKAAEVGEQTNRSQMAAALILEATRSLSPEEVTTVLARYASAKIVYRVEVPEQEQG